MSHSEWMIREYLRVQLGECPGCHHREWIPVTMSTFVTCYALRIDAGMTVLLRDKISDCSRYVGYCTCHK